MMDELIDMPIEKHHILTVVDNTVKEYYFWC